LSAALKVGGDGIGSHGLECNQSDDSSTGRVCNGLKHITPGLFFICYHLVANIVATVWLRKIVLVFFWGGIRQMTDIQKKDLLSELIGYQSNWGFFNSLIGFLSIDSGYFTRKRIKA